MGKYVDLHLFMHLSFFLFFHLRSFLGVPVQVTAGRDSNNLVFEGFSRHIQKLSLCFSTRQPIPTMGWIRCEWADDYMTPTWLKRHCVVLVAPLTLVFLSLAVVGLFLHRSFMVKEAPLHLQVFCESSTSIVVWAIVYFFLGPLLYAERSNQALHFDQSSNDYESCWEMKLAILVGRIAIWKKQCEHLQKITGKFEKLNGIHDADTFLLVYYLSGEKCACVNFIHFLFVHSR